MEAVEQRGLGLTWKKAEAKTECDPCTLTQTRPHCGAYRMQCLQCCVRLVQSARPVRALQESMLTAIARYHDAPKRAEVLAEIARQKKGAA